MLDSGPCGLVLLQSSNVPSLCTLVMNLSDFAQIRAERVERMFSPKVNSLSHFTDCSLQRTRFNFFVHSDWTPSTKFVQRSSKKSGIRPCLPASHFVFHLGTPSKKLETKGVGISSANLESRSAFDEHLLYSMSLPNASPPALVAVQTESFVDIHNDSPSHSSTDTTGSDKPTGDDHIVALFKNSPKRSALAVVCITPPYTQ